MPGFLQVLGGGLTHGSLYLFCIPYLSAKVFSPLDTTLLVLPPRLFICSLSKVLSKMSCLQLSFTQIFPTSEFYFPHLSGSLGSHYGLCTSLFMGLFPSSRAARPSKAKSSSPSIVSPRAALMLRLWLKDECRNLKWWQGRWASPCSMQMFEGFYKHKHFHWAALKRVLLSFRMNDSNGEV